MPRFSIVLTTTDRQSLLPAAIRAVLAMRFDDFELIVSDNFSQPSAAEIVAQFDDPRIRYLRTERRINMTDHWEFVWEHVRGEFAMYAGDDNALHPDILAQADRAIDQHGLDLVSWRVCHYFHPDWDVAYGNLPRRGNVLTFDPGTTGRLYRGVPSAILRNYCAELRLHGCFPMMPNCLFRREHVAALRARMGRIFWPIAADVSISYFLLGTVPPERFAILDGYGAIAGRSRNSILAGFLTRGATNRRANELFSEYKGADYFPHHPVKFNCYSNVLAAIISQARTLIPETFGVYDYSPRTLALRTLDDIYTLRATPWANDPRFLEEVEQFLRSLPAGERDEVMRYRDKCIRDARDEEAVAQDAGNPDRSDDPRRLWAIDRTYYIDMALFGGCDIADAAACLPEILGLLDHPSDRYIERQQADGYVADALTSPGDGEASLQAVAADQPVSARSALAPSR